MAGSVKASPFEDPSLHLAVLDAAWKKKLLPEFDKWAFYRDVLKRDWEAERDGYDVDNDVLAALLAIPLPAGVLAAIDEIEWGGGHVAQHLVFHFWDGEDETFTVGDLSGIESCVNLRDLDLGAASLSVLDPLRGLRKLESFSLAYGGAEVTLSYQGRIVPGRSDDDEGLQDLTPLLDLSALQHLDIGRNYRNDERNRDVLAKLKARGVQLETREEIKARQVAGHQASYLKDALERGLRAFQEKQYAETVSRLAPHESSLDGSTRLKLQYARKKIAGG